MEWSGGRRPRDPQIGLVSCPVIRRATVSPRFRLALNGQLFNKDRVLSTGSAAPKSVSRG